MFVTDKKVVKSEYVVALRKNLDLVCQWVEAVDNAINLPVSVNIRVGWSNENDLVDFELRVQNAGANMICIHAGIYVESYKVASQYEQVYALQDALSMIFLYTLSYS